MDRVSQMKSRHLRQRQLHQLEKDNAKLDAEVRCFVGRNALTEFLYNIGTGQRSSKRGRKPACANASS